MYRLGLAVLVGADVSGPVFLEHEVGIIFLHAQGEYPGSVQPEILRIAGHGLYGSLEGSGEDVYIDTVLLQGFVETAHFVAECKPVWDDIAYFAGGTHVGAFPDNVLDALLCDLRRHAFLYESIHLGICEIVEQSCDGEETFTIVEGVVDSLVQGP